MSVSSHTERPGNSPISKCRHELDYLAKQCTKLCCRLSTPPSPPPGGVSITSTPSHSPLFFLLHNVESVLALPLSLVIALSCTKKYKKMKPNPSAKYSISRWVIFVCVCVCSGPFSFYLKNNRQTKQMTIYPGERAVCVCVCVFACI